MYFYNYNYYYAHRGYILKNCNIVKYYKNICFNLIYALTVPYSCKGKAEFSASNDFSENILICCFAYLPIVHWYQEIWGKAQNPYN